MNIVEVLRGEEAKLSRQLTAIQQAIAALNGSAANVSSRANGNVAGTHVKRTMSAAVRARISQKAKERWAKIKADQAKRKKS